MTKLEAENKALREENLYLRSELESLKKLLFGSRRERFVPHQDPAQGKLFDDSPAPAEEPVQEQKTEKKSKNKARSLSKKRIKRNEFPSHLPREVQVLEPEEIDIEQSAQIGEDITEILAYQAGSMYVKRIVRPIRVVKKQEQAEEPQIRQAPIPVRLIPKGMVDESLIAELIVEKILYHTPIHRFGKKLKQAGVDMITDSNLYNWFYRGGESLLPLYHLLKEDLLAQPYNQADETPIPVLSKNKPGSTHRGFIWVLHNPRLKAVCFQYEQSRSQKAGKALLEDYEGILQTDGYEVYEALAREKEIQLIHCMAHSRRKFKDAQNSDPPRAEYFLDRVQKLYLIERRAREDGLNDKQRRELRQEKALPILSELGNWLEEQFKEGQLLPKSPIGKAVAYSLKRWKRLSAYAHDGRLEIDNNLIENTIRPIALGRKNYLFAGSHDAARQLACLYSIIGTSQQYGLNAVKYLEWLLRKVAASKVTKDALNWLPHRMDEDTLAKFRT